MSTIAYRRVFLAAAVLGISSIIAWADPGRIPVEDDLIGLRNGVYIDCRGNTVLTVDCAGSGPFSEGLAAVRPQAGGRSGFMDRSGKLVIAPQFDAVSPFSCGRAVVGLNSSPYKTEYGFIDRKGNIVIAPQFDDVEEPFRDGVALVGTLTAVGRLKTALTLEIGIAIADGNVSYRYIDMDGRAPGDPGFDERGLWKENVLLPLLIGGKYGYVDRTGAKVIAPQFESAGRFQDGIALVEKNGRKGFIKTDGSDATPLTFENAREFSEGVAPAAIRDVATKELAWGILGENGAWVVPPRGDWLWMGKSSEGLIAVETLAAGKRKVGYVDRTGRWVITPFCDFGDEFRHGVAEISMTARSGGHANRECFIDNKGAFIWKHPDVD